MLKSILPDPATCLTFMYGKSFCTSAATNSTRPITCSTSGTAAHNTLSACANVGFAHLGAARFCGRWITSCEFLVEREGLPAVVSEGCSGAR